MEASTKVGGGRWSNDNRLMSDKRTGEEAEQQERSEKHGGLDHMHDVDVDDVDGDGYADGDGDGGSEEDGEEEEVRKDRDPPPGCVRLR